MAKIHIIGGPGSGKSTLAQELAGTLSVPHYDLDLLGQKNGSDPEAHIEDAMSIAGASGWVVEGIYVVSVDPFLYEADHIVLLDVSWRVAAWRIIKRHISKTLQGTNQYPGFKPLISFLGYARNYYCSLPLERTDLMNRCLQEHRNMVLPPAREAMVTFLDTYHEVSIPSTLAFVRLYLAKYQEKVIVVQTNSERGHLVKRLAPIRTTTK